MYSREHLFRILQGTATACTQSHFRRRQSPVRLYAGNRHGLWGVDFADDKEMIFKSYPGLTTSRTCNLKDSRVHTSSYGRGASGRSAHPWSCHLQNYPSVARANPKTSAHFSALELRTICSRLPALPWESRVSVPDPAYRQGGRQQIRTHWFVTNRRPNDRAQMVSKRTLVSRI